jgi:hypothetical protein
MPLSTVRNPHIPLGLKALVDVTYKGAIRPIAGGESDSNYAVGADITKNRTIATTAKMIFPHSGGREMVEGGTKYRSGAFDNKSNTLYISLANAARVGRYDRPPLIVAYEFMSKEQL